MPRPFSGSLDVSRQMGSATRTSMSSPRYLGSFFSFCEFFFFLYATFIHFLVAQTTTQTSGSLSSFVSFLDSCSLCPTHGPDVQVVHCFSGLSVTFATFERYLVGRCKCQRVSDAQRVGVLLGFPLLFPSFFQLCLFSYSLFILACMVFRFHII